MTGTRTYSCEDPQVFLDAASQIGSQGYEEVRQTPPESACKSGLA